MSVRFLTVPILCLAASAVLTAQAYKNTAPESFRINGQVTDTPGGVAASMTLQIDKYTSDEQHQALEAALKSGSNTAFLDALKKAPVVGSLKMGERLIPIRWARQQVQGEKRRVAAVTESPVFFFGAGAADAKPTAGYDVGALEFTIDSVGMGKGTMAAAAKLKPGGPTGIEVEDYSGKRIELTTVTRNQK